MELSKERKHLKEVRQLVVAYLASIVEPVNNYHLALKKLAEGISRADQEDFVYEESSARPDFLISIPQVDLFKVFLLGSRDEKDARIAVFNSLQGTLDFLNRQNLVSKLEFSDFVAKFNRYVETFRTQTNQILRYHDTFLQTARSIGAPASSDPFLKEFNRLVHELAQSNRTDDIPFTLTLFIEPIRELCRTYSSDQRTVVLSPYLVEASTAARNRQNLIALYSRYFADESEKLVSKVESIKNAHALLSK